MAFKQFLEDLYAPMPGVTIRSMFGGLGIFCDAVMFALAVDDVLYLRGEAETGGPFPSDKAPQFVYHGMTGRDVAMPYWRLPDRLHYDPDEFIAHSEKAFAVAMQAATLKTRGKNTKKPRGADTAKPGTKDGDRKGRRLPPIGKR